MPVEIRLHRFEEADVGSAYVLVHVDPNNKKILSYSISKDPIQLGRKAAEYANQSFTGVAIETDLSESMYVGRLDDLKGRNIEVFELSDKEHEDFWRGYLSAPPSVNY